MNYNTTLRGLLKRGTAASAYALTMAAATFLPAGSARAADQIEELVVTASSRLDATGFNAPTPTTVLGVQELQASAPISIGDALKLQIPAFRTSGLSSTSVAFANLRTLGANRTLVLLDGRRIVPTQPDGTVDLNMIPSALIQRAEVVTGGASAAWGSDAVAGVVNLGLKTRLQGIEGSAQGGFSKYGDKKNYKFSVAGGTSFAGDKGHVLAGVEYARDYGIEDLQYPFFSRPWGREDRGSVGNSAFAANQLPGTIYAANVHRADVGPGGLITVGPLRGLLFNSSGPTSTFQYGTVYGNNMIGGQNAGETPVPGGQVAFPFERYTAMAHAEYDLSDNISSFLELSYGHALAQGFTNPNRQQGSVTAAPTCTTSTVVSGIGAINININNPYLPASVVQAMQAANISCFSMGRSYRDVPRLESRDGSPYMWRVVGGLKGELGKDWSWDTYYQYGINKFQQRRGNNMNVPRMRLAVDAVRNPAGQIVCRSTLTNPADGCVPINLFGQGNITSAAYNYVFGTSTYDAKTTQHVAEVNLRGKPFSTWAGPVAVAAGVGYRKEAITAVADPVSQALGWATGQRQGTAGSYDVKEGYGEIGVPLARDTAWAYSLDLNAAVRYTDYSSSGHVTTWKVGGTYDATEELRLRVSRSRDIRAGTLAELFTATQTATGNVQNPITGALSPALQITTGNPTLSPEKADTITGGIVYQPDWVPSLRLSADYYDIQMNNAIGSVTAQQTANFCYLNNLAQYCSLIVTNAAGAITQVTVRQQNLSVVHAEGLDFEASYQLELNKISRAPGAVTFRVVGTYIKDLSTIASPGATPTQAVGLYTNPKWSVFGSARYDLDKASATIELQYYGGGMIDNTKILGQASSVGVNINNVSRTIYTHIAGSYKIHENAEVFARVNNLFNVAPPFPSNGGGIFDQVGLAFTGGVRFKL